MTRFLSSCFLVFSLLFSLYSPASAQQDEAEELLRSRGEVYLIFKKLPPDRLRILSGRISIDAIRKDSVIACVNEKGYRFFLAQKLPYRVFMYPRPKEYEKAKSIKGLSQWDTYPTYEQYDSIMHNFAVSYPALCRVDTIGTSVQGRLLLAVKISDNVNNDKAEPEFFYTSTMHGDEPGGYVMLLHLADYLLRNYATDSLVHTLIDSLEIWINPLANPDGTYHSGDETISGATRFNANGIDLNRNFPDPRDGPHPDGNEYAPETTAMMRFMESRHFVMSANFHAGAEVVNYPWDAWTSSEKTHADDMWFRFISREYADTVHKYSPRGYMTDLDNGITNGGDWYVITGGRQDFMTFFLHGRETTIELDHTKMTPANELDSLWRYNYHSLLNYIHEAFWGMAGFVIDSATGHPLWARIEIPGHDYDSSHVFSDSLNGYFHRVIAKGTYDLAVSASGYKTKIIPQVSVSTHHLTWLTISLSPSSANSKNIYGTRFSLFPNPVSAGSDLFISWPDSDTCTIALTNTEGRRIILAESIPFHPGNNRFSLPKHLSGLWFVTVVGKHSGPVTQKLVILP